ncbi:MAG: hypothetical protein D6793_02115 [Thermoflexia bacterium]|nr:MAG: hypothetical protein D6793_02115 [Thermoflexia bacterium]
MGVRKQAMATVSRPILFPVERWLCIFLLGVILLLLPGDAPPPGALETRLYRLVADYRFNFREWEARALWGKFTLWLLQPQRYMTESERSAFLQDWVARVQEAQKLERQIADLYADPSVQNPDEATAAMRQERARMRQEIALRQPIAEAILEEQVGVVLARDASGLLGQPFPQVGIHITPLPLVLIVSLRERITVIGQEELLPGLGVDQQEALERQVDEALGVSSLVTPIGGMSAWPAMVLEYPDLTWWIEVAAHEWVHHYLSLFPLGWSYTENWEARAINETVASIVGQEIARRTVIRYYPEEEPPPEPVPEEEGEKVSPPPPSGRPPAFDFRAEMYETRIRVDALLLQGRIEEAERYMEQRRRVFWEHGYRIRKLNQAYFAFYGSYAAAPGGAAGKDPIGPAVRQLWRQTRDPRRFLTAVRRVTSLEELQRLLVE